MNKALITAFYRTTTSKHVSASRKPCLLLILLKSRLRVLGGPFRGVRYVGASAGSGFFPKLLGTYELELAGIMESVIARQPDVVVDAGAAEGYFAVGLATRCPAARVVTYDMNLRACYYLDVLATANGVRERVLIHWQACTAEALESGLTAGAAPFLLMDVEGAEEWLLDPQKAPSLQKTEILVELHEDGGRKDLACTLRERFAASHAAELIDSRPRILSDLPVSLWPFRKSAVLAMNEGRDPGQRWLHLTPLEKE